MKQKPDDCPQNVWDTFRDPSPDWDWVRCRGYFIARLYEEGEETERVLCKVILDAVK